MMLRLLRQTRFTLRESALFIVIVAVALSWWMDRWRDNGVARFATNEAHARWIDGFQSELQRVADETGRPVRIKSTGMSLSFEPARRNP